MIFIIIIIIMNPMYKHKQMINPLIKHINHPIDPSHPPAPADIAVVLIASESLRGHIPREAAEMAP